MRAVERRRKLRHLVDIRDCIEYMQERVRLADLAEVAVIEKNLSYAKRKEEELCKQIGYGDSINSLENLQEKNA